MAITNAALVEVTGPTGCWQWLSGWLAERSAADDVGLLSRTTQCRARCWCFASSYVAVVQCTLLADSGNTGEILCGVSESGKHALAPPSGKKNRADLLTSQSRLN